MNLDVQRPFRKSTRLRDYDYAQPGLYFVTICTRKRECILGYVKDGRVRLNEYGELAESCWSGLGGRFVNVETHEHVVMPNHFHGILALIENCRGGVSPPVGVGAGTAPLHTATLGHAVACFKYESTRSINRLRCTPGASVWQRNYYEHVIRNEHDLRQVREYIANNPLRWELDRENPDNLGARQSSARAWQ